MEQNYKLLVNLFFLDSYLSEEFKWKYSLLLTISCVTNYPRLGCPSSILYQQVFTS